MHREGQVSLLVERKTQIIVSLLDGLCQRIEITENQYQQAKSRYEAVGVWLSDSISPHLSQAKIYPQGSIALGTTMKPLAANEFDIDLVCHLPSLGASSDAKAVKALIGARLQEHGTYKLMLEEKQRCWRVNYANEFHLDITPSIANNNCAKGGELVPDKALAFWKPTNPKGYLNRFEAYASISPKITTRVMMYSEARAEVAPIPEQTMSKPILKRIVQLLKRHRDHKYFAKPNAKLAPISVIITTLAAWAYAKCASQQAHQDEFDFITSVIRAMPSFIRIEERNGMHLFVIENETTVGENFADKWNSDPRLASEFYDWHCDALSSIDSLLQLEGVDQFTESLSNSFGARKVVIKEIFEKLVTPIGQARSAGLLSIAPSVGLIATHSYGAITVPKNTFFGL